MSRYFKCMGLNEGKVKQWKQDFTIGKTYEAKGVSDTELILIGDFNETYYVSIDQFTEVSTMVEKSKLKPIAFDLGINLSDDLVREFERVFGKVTAITEEKLNPFSGKDYIKEQLKDPNLSEEDMDVLLDKLHNLK